MNMFMYIVHIQVLINKSCVLADQTLFKYHSQNIGTILIIIYHLNSLGLMYMYDAYIH